MPAIISAIMASCSDVSDMPANGTASQAPPTIKRALTPISTMPQVTSAPGDMRRALTASMPSRA